MSKLLRYHPKNAYYLQSYGSYPNKYIMNGAGGFQLDAASQQYWDLVNNPPVDDDDDNSGAD